MPEGETLILPPTEVHYAYQLCEDDSVCIEANLQNADNFGGRSVWSLKICVFIRAEKKFITWIDENQISCSDNNRGTLTARYEEELFKISAMSGSKLICREPEVDTETILKISYEVHFD